MNSNFDETRSFSIPSEATNSAERIIMAVYQALKAKGYDPITQIVGYILSGDPTYITSYNNARLSAWSATKFWKNWCAFM